MSVYIHTHVVRLIYFFKKWKIVYFSINYIRTFSSFFTLKMKLLRGNLIYVENLELVMHNVYYAQYVAVLKCKTNIVMQSFVPVCLLVIILLNYRLLPPTACMQVINSHSA